MEERYTFNPFRERLGAALVMATGLYGYLAIAGVSEQSRLFPRIVSVLMVVGAALILLRSFRRTAGAGNAADVADDDSIAVVAEGRFSGAMRVAVAAAMSGAYVLAVPVVGFAIATAAFMVCSALVFGYRNWLAILLTTIAYVAFMTWVLRRVFFVLVPEPLLNL
jgi:hypothetical protein